MLIRIASQADVAEIAKMNVAMAKETEAKNLVQATIEKGVSNAIRQDVGLYFLAYKSEHVLGTLMVTKEWSDWRNAFFWWIQSVYIPLEHRRKGVYRALHSHVRKAAKEAPNVCGLRLYVDRDNTNAQKTYAAMGMAASNYLFFEELLD